MRKFRATALTFCLCLLSSAAIARAAVIKLVPESNTAIVGEPLKVSIILDTQGRSVNAVDAEVRFPANMMQIISAGGGQSVLDVWTITPKYDNSAGTIDLQGGIPGGLTTSDGAILDFVFRPRSIGDALIQFSGDTQILANDGKGTNVLSSAVSADIHIVLPPPQGPAVSSDSNPDQRKWYRDHTVMLRWKTDYPVDGYAYSFNDIPVDSPSLAHPKSDTSVTYNGAADGAHFFHIRALRNGVWGGATNFAVNVDSSPPAEFPISVIPSGKDSPFRPVITFETTDGESGIDRYELNIVPLNNTARASGGGQQTLFIEARSPYISSPLAAGLYNVIVRAYDRAGNMREEVASFGTGPGGGILSGSVSIGNFSFPVWLLVVSIVTIAVVVFLWKWRKRYFLLKAFSGGRKMPKRLEADLKELEAYKRKYKKLLISALLVSSIFLGGLRVNAAAGAAPPVITAVADHIAQSQFWYALGTGEQNSSVILYIQNIKTGQVAEVFTNTDQRGNWFYQSPALLAPGNYDVWVKTVMNGTKSQSTGTLPFTVSPDMINLLGLSVPYDTLGETATVALTALIIMLAAAAVVYRFHARRREKMLRTKMEETDHLLRREFSVLAHSLGKELAGLERGVSSQERIKYAEELREDIRRIEGKLSRKLYQAIDYSE